MKREDVKPWRKRLWGVMYTRGAGKPILLGSHWHDVIPTPYHGEPTHALTFCTRSQAREWCCAQDRKYAEYPAGHACLDWRFRPVRVTEIVRERRGRGKGRADEKTPHRRGVKHS